MEKPCSDCVVLDLSKSQFITQPMLEIELAAARDFWSVAGQ